MNLTLRPYQPSDAAVITSWLKSEYLMRQWCADRYECLRGFCLKYRALEIKSCVCDAMFLHFRYLLCREQLKLKKE